MNLAERLSQLGTETAFAVSIEAARHAAAGNRVYPFHLGDLNLPTPENIQQAAVKAMQDGKTGYCPNAGVTELREALAEEINASHGTSYTADNVAIQPGGKPVIGKFIMALMNPGDAVLYPNPGFPIYESMIEFHGGTAVPYGFVEGKDSFELDMEQVERGIAAGARLMIYNDLQNPTAAESSPQELERIAALVREHNLYVLVDEAYLDIRFGGRSASLVSLPGMAERCVILYTFSKKFAMTGWRLGAAIGPSDVIAPMIRMNVNDESCSNHFVQYAAIEALRGDQSEVRRMIDTLHQRRDKAVDILNSIDGVFCYRPNATFYLYPNVTEAMTRKGMAEYEALRIGALQETGVSFCTRLHFGRELPGEQNKYVRLAYSGIDLADIEEGLTKLRDYLQVK